VRENKDADAGEKNRDFFKQAFSPRIVQLVPAYYAVLKPVEHAVLFNAWRWYRRSPLKKVAGKLLRSN